MQQEVTEMFLCEKEHLILKPNVLYRFLVDENCDECRTLAAFNKEQEEQEAQDKEICFMCGYHINDCFCI